jgi:hypothetical protein
MRSLPCLQWQIQIAWEYYSHESEDRCRPDIGRFANLIRRCFIYSHRRILHSSSISSPIAGIVLRKRACPGPQSLLNTGSPPNLAKYFRQLAWSLEMSASATRANQTPRQDGRLSRRRYHCGSAVSVSVVRSTNLRLQDVVFKPISCTPSRSVLS